MPKSPSHDAAAAEEDVLGLQVAVHDEARMWSSERDLRDPVEDLALGEGPRDSRAFRMREQAPSSAYAVTMQRYSLRGSRRSLYAMMFGRLLRTVPPGASPRSRILCTDLRDVRPALAVDDEWHVP